jgi:hypothetical protein
MSKSPNLISSLYGSINNALPHLANSLEKFGGTFHSQWNIEEKFTGQK